MKLVLLLVVIFSFILKSSLAIQCQTWKKGPGHAVSWRSWQDCLACSSTIIYRNNLLFYEAGCYDGLMATPLTNECQSEQINGTDTFTCVCDTEACNSYPQLVHQAHRLQAFQGLNAKLPAIDWSNGSISPMLTNMFVILSMFLVVMIQI